MGKLVLTVVALSGAAPGALAQSNGVLVPLGPNPQALAAADLDGDGSPDLIAARANPHFITTKKNLGPGAPGAFGAGADVAITEFPVSLASGDVTGDGLADAVAAVPNAATPSFLLLAGNGSLGFAPSIAIPSMAIQAIFLEDLDLDGDLDVVGRTSTQLAYQLNIGGGSFAPPTAVTPLAAYPSPPPLSEAATVHAAALADVDHDGRRDFVAVVTNVYVPNGSGGLQTHKVLVWFPTQPNGSPGPIQWVAVPPTNPALAVGIGGLAVGDVDGDGSLDAVHTTLSSAFGTSFFELFAGQGTGFLAPLPFKTQFLGDGLDKSIAIVDVTNDGKADVLYTKAKVNTVALRPGGNHPVVGSETEFATYGRTPWTLAIADFDGDGIPDLATANRFSDNATILLSTGDGRFRGVPGFRGAPDPQPNATNWKRVRATDATDDGLVDLVHGTSGGSLGIRAGVGDGTFGPETPIPGTTLYEDFDWGDFDSDGVRDLVGMPASGAIQLFRGLGFGNYALAQSQALIGAPRSLAIGDVNGDGIPDAVTSGGGVAAGTSLVTYLGQGLALLPGIESTTHGTAPTVFDGAQKLALIDVSLSGSPEAASCVFAAAAIALQPNLGGGSFGPGSLISTTPAAGPVAVLACDLNADGKPDLAVANRTAPNYFATVFLNNGAGGFLASQGYPAGLNPNAIHSGDANGDGSVDLFVVNSLGDGGVSVLFNDGGGGFSQPAMFTGESLGRFAAVADVDGSGKPSYLQAQHIGLGVLVEPAGAVPYGTGTSGCDGVQGLLANHSAKVGSNSFGITCTQAPATSLGLVLVADAFDVVGSDPFDIRITLHLDLAAASWVGAFDAVSDLSGRAFVPMPIPNDPGLAGTTWGVQFLWAWKACVPTTYTLSSSRGLAFFIQ